MLLNSQKKKIQVFGIIYATMIIILVFLLFLNFGLEFEKEQVGNKTVVFVSNNSVHLIKDVNVFANDKLIKTVSELEPRQKIEIVLPKENFIKLRAEAPFHITATAEIGLSTSQISPLTFKTSYPNPIIKNQKFEFKLIICNQSDNSLNAKIKENHDIFLFKEGGKTNILSIQANACKTQTYELTPLKKGKMLIFFNINAQEFVDGFEAEIEVK